MADIISPCLPLRRRKHMQSHTIIARIPRYNSHYHPYHTLFFFALLAPRGTRSRDF